VPRLPIDEPRASRAPAGVARITWRKRDLAASAGLLLVLLATGAGAWSLALRPPLELDPSPLAALPFRIDSWQGQEVPLETAVESVLRADFNLQRAYAHPLGERVWLYIGYYGTERGGRPEHTPAACYRAQGWGIESRRRLAVAGVSGLRVNEYVVARGGERQLVHFWYRSFRRTGLLGGFDQMADRLAGRLATGRADGALVRLSTELGGGGDAVDGRTRLLLFAARLDPLLAEHWPTERQSEGR